MSETRPLLAINPDRIELDEAYLQMAEIWAKRSKAVRNQVGALIVNNRQLISDGYNGMPTGAEDDVCEFYDFNGHLTTKPDVLHAESNALLKITKAGGRGAHGATMYVTLSPCTECAKLITQSEISRVVFRHLYRDDAGIHLLRKYGVQVTHLPQPSETKS